MVIGLTRRFGPSYLDLIENSVQDAMLRAMETWPGRGVPEEPTAWIRRVAQNLMIDRLRRDTAFRRKQDAIEASLYENQVPAGPISEPQDDDVLRMMLVCCHPHLTPRARVALVLRHICGFGVGQIARALLSTEAGIRKSLTRAKQAIRDEGLRFDWPEDAALEAGLESVLDSLYLLFNEGYLAHDGDDLVRRELCGEAIRVVDLILACRLEEPGRVRALAALLHLQASRLAARSDASGRLLTLAEQNRGLWDQALIKRGIHLLGLSMTGARPTAYHLQAAIAACHALAPSYQETDWPRILSLYDDLLRALPSPIVALNRAVAVTMTEGPSAGLAVLDRLEGQRALRGNHLLPALKADFLRRAGRIEAAAPCYAEALKLATNRRERRFLRERLSACTFDYAANQCPIPPLSLRQEDERAGQAWRAVTATRRQRT